MIPNFAPETLLAVMAAAGQPMPEGVIDLDPDALVTWVCEGCEVSGRGPLGTRCWYCGSAPERYRATSEHHFRIVGVKDAFHHDPTALPALAYSESLFGGEVVVGG